MNTILSKLIRIHMKIDMITVDKSGPEAKIKMLFISCKSVFAEEIGLNWLIMSSFGCAVLLRKLLDFHKSGRWKRQIQIALFVCESILHKKLVQLGSWRLLGALYCWENCWFFGQNWTPKRPKSKCFYSLWFTFRNRNWVKLARGFFWGASYIWGNGYFLTKVDAREAKIKMLSFCVNQFSQKKLVQIG